MRLKEVDINTLEAVRPSMDSEESELEDSEESEESEESEFMSKLREVSDEEYSAKLMGRLTKPAPFETDWGKVYEGMERHIAEEAKAEARQQALYSAGGMDEASLAALDEQIEKMKLRPKTLSEVGEFLKSRMPTSIEDVGQRILSYAGTPSAPAEPFSIDWFTRVAPESAMKNLVGIPTSLLYQIPKSFTDPIVENIEAKAYGDPRMYGKADAKMWDDIGKSVYATADGMARFSGEQLGVYGEEAFKERWSKDPVGAILGLIPFVKGVLGKMSIDAAGINKKILFNEEIRNHLRKEQVKWDLEKKAQEELAKSPDFDTLLKEDIADKTSKLEAQKRFKNKKFDLERKMSEVYGEQGTPFVQKLNKEKAKAKKKSVEPIADEDFIARGEDQMWRDEQRDKKVLVDTKREGDVRVLSNTDTPKARGLANVLASWARMLGLKFDFVLDSEAAVEGMYRREFGAQIRYPGVDYGPNYGGATKAAVIDIKEGAKIPSALESLAHEVGHLFGLDKFFEAPDAVRIAIFKEFVRWQEGKTSDKAYMSKIPAYQFFKEKKKIAKNEKAGYTVLYPENARSFDEWFADNTAKWALTSKEPFKPVDKFFSEIAKGIKRLYEFSGKDFKATKSFQEFMDEHVRTVKGGVVREAKSPKPKKAKADKTVVPPVEPAESKGKKSKGPRLQEDKIVFDIRGAEKASREEVLEMLDQFGELLAQKYFKKSMEDLHKEGLIDQLWKSVSDKEYSKHERLFEIWTEKALDDGVSVDVIESMIPSTRPGKVPKDIESPFFVNKEIAEKRAKVYNDPDSMKRHSKNVESFTMKLVNDTNLWYYGDDAIKIQELRDSLSELSIRKNELNTPDNFGSNADFNKWADTVDEAAAWARKLERPTAPAEVAGQAVSSSKRLSDQLSKTLIENRGFDAGKAAEVTERVQRVLESIEADFPGVLKGIKSLTSNKLKNRHGETLANNIVLDSLDERTLLHEIAETLIDRGQFGRGKTSEDISKEALADGISYVLGERIGVDIPKPKPEILEASRELVSKSATSPIGKEVIKDIHSPEEIAKAKAFESYGKLVKDLKSPSFLQRSKEVVDFLRRKLLDRSANIINDLNSFGDEGYRVVQRLINARGMGAYSAQFFRQMSNEVWKGLSKAEKEVTNSIIFARRRKEIAGYKPDVKHPILANPKNAEAYLNNLESLTGFSPEKVADLSKRADAYFEWMRKALTDLKDEGLITPELFDKLIKFDYQRTQMIKILDEDYGVKFGTKKHNVVDHGVEFLSKGKPGEILEMDAELLALEVINRTYGRIFSNRANKALYEFAQKNPENPFVRVKRDKGEMALETILADGDKVVTDKIPHGWMPVSLFIEGKKKSAWMPESFASEWVAMDKDISYQWANFFRVISGSSILRPMATGINWAFAFANVPRDLLHIWTSSNYMKGGDWHSTYSSIAPRAMAQMGVDIAQVFRDAVSRSGRWQAALEDGMGFEFLTHQGRLLKRGVNPAKGALASVEDFLGYFGETSEILTRLALRERMIKNEAKARGISVEEARNLEDVRQHASFVARDYMDFGQGGGFTKAADAGIPYLNAAVQATRGLWHSATRNKAEFTAKLIQIQAAATALAAVNTYTAPEGYKEVSDTEKRNNFIIMLSDDFGFEDEEGQKRYIYLKIPADPGQRFVKRAAEYSFEKLTGQEPPASTIAKSLQEMSPVSTQNIVPPSVQAWVGYMTNTDFWLQEDIWKGREVNPEAEFQMGETPGAMIDVGQATGLSPERLNYALSRVFTQGNMWTWMLGKGYDAAFSDLPKEVKQQHIAMILAENPIAKRFIGVTSPYPKHAEEVDTIEKDYNTRTWLNTTKMDFIADRWLYDGSVSREEVVKFIKSVKDPNEQERLYDRLQFKVRTRDLPDKTFWLRIQRLTPEARARVVWNEKMKDADEEQRRLLSREMSRVPELFSDRFYQELGRIRKQER